MDFGQATPGPGSDVSAIALCTSDITDVCPHEPCVPFYLQTDNSETNTNTYEEFDVDYPSGGGYDAFTLLINLQSGIPNPVPDIWSKCNRDRTNAGPAGLVLIGVIASAFPPIIAESICEISDDIEVPVVCVDLPNPGTIACAIGKGVLEAIKLAFETLYEQIQYQDGLVDGAETEAIYEHSRNLLTKQW